MTRKLKILTIALFALGALFVPMASAAEFHSEVKTTELKGVQATENIYTAGAGKIQCTKAEFTGLIFDTTTVKGVTVHPTYSGCTAFGLATDVTTTQCDFSLDGFGFAQLICGASGPMKFQPTLFGSVVCTITMGSQTLFGSVDYTNQGSGSTRDVLVTSTLTNIKYTVDGGGGVCGTVGEHSEGAYDGSFTLKGYKYAENVQTGIWVE